MINILKVCLFFAFFTFSSCAVPEYPNDKRYQEESENPLIENFPLEQFKPRNYFSENFPIGNPLSYISNITIYDVARSSAFVISGLWVTLSLIPGLLTTFGIRSPFSFRSFTDMPLIELRDLNFNYDTVVDSLKSLPDRSFDVFNIKSECRARAVCEIGEYFSSQFPTVGFYTRNLDKFLTINDKYALAVFKGMQASHGTCGRMYSSCTNSPFKRFSVPFAFIVNKILHLKSL